MLKNSMLVLLGGGIGSVFRYLISETANKYIHLNMFPGIFAVNFAGTMVVNIAGSFIIGFLYGIITASAPLKLLFITGFCGGFTTYSTFSYENVKLLEAGQYATMFLYTGLTVVTGMGSVFAGMMAAKHFTI